MASRQIPSSSSRKQMNGRTIHPTEPAVGSNIICIRQYQARDLTIRQITLMHQGASCACSKMVK